MPVGKEDVTEVLCRRFFEPDSIRDRSAFRSHVIGAVRRLAKIDDATASEGAGVEQRFCTVPEPRHDAALGAHS